MTDANKGPSCNMHEALVSYLYDEAAGDEVRLIETHLKNCPVCAEELNAFKGVRTMLQHWEIEDMPILRMAQASGRRSVLAVLRELLTIAPLWIKAAGALAAAMLVLAVAGTEVSVGRQGVTFRTGLFGRSSAPVAAAPARAGSGPVPASVNGVTADQVKEIVNRAIVEDDRRQKDALTAEVVRLEEQVRNTRSSELAKIALKLQEQRDRIKTLETDIYRREGSDVADILFNSSGAGTKGTSSEENDEDGR
jgi:hypothetical protein